MRLTFGKMLWSQRLNEFFCGYSYLLYNEECLCDFDSQYKISPPWQDAVTQKALEQVMASASKE